MILIGHWEGASYIEYIDWFLRFIFNYSHTPLISITHYHIDHKGNLSNVFIVLTFISLKCISTNITFIFKMNSSNMSLIIYLPSSKMHNVHFDKGNYSDTFDTAILWNKGVIENNVINVVIHFGKRIIWWTFEDILL